ncbi:MAG TPA: hypothetical protein VMP01_23610 [Pirellulaceae bacterium]|nr:hypothetical protein [Pirellulaceae bacterium]
MYTFQERLSSQSVQTRLRRLGDLTIPNSPLGGDTARGIPRHNRAIPTLICPWRDGAADVSRCTIAITRDLGDEGVGLLLTHPVSGPELLVGYLLPDAAVQSPWYFRGTIQHNTAIGGGFWVVGVALLEFFTSQRHSSLIALEPWAKKLLPPASDDA